MASMNAQNNADEMQHALSDIDNEQEQQQPAVNLDSESESDAGAMLCSAPALQLAPALFPLCSHTC